ncbi:Mitochondrial translocator assembly and maintenance protein 41 [Mortierella claussenii]|nr:Mitochondrial translocator assembly and maintenance protein 41 [Mortierella claussenii]
MASGTVRAQSVETSAAIARCQQQGLRYAVAWAPKGNFALPESQSDHRVTTHRRTFAQIAVNKHNHSRISNSSTASSLSSSGAQLSSRLLSEQKRAIHASAIINTSSGASAAAAVETSQDTNPHHHVNAVSHGNSISRGSFTGTPSVRQRRPNYIRDFEVPPDMSRLPPKFGDNQHIDIDNEVWERLKSVVDTIHHKAPIRYAFAYGSGVFAQKGYDGKKKPMVDFIFAVSHPQHWHSLNLQANPHHYSLLGKMGSKVIATTQERFGAGLYFNPFVEVNGMTIKYGVVSIDTLCNDLLNWETMYVSGRLHKPVKILIDDPRTRLSNQVNLFNATRVALLSLPNKFTSEELFTKIAGLSYLGDFRMSIGENPHKVQNIVKAQLSQFHRLYDPLLANLNNVTTLREGFLEQDDSPLVRSRTFQKLPPKLKTGVLYRYHSALSKAGVEIVKEEGEEIQSVATAPDVEQYLNKTIHSIVQIPALSQSIKGIATAGVVKTAKYGVEKLGKWWKREK